VAKYPHYSRDTACDTMNRKKLKKLKRKIQSLRAGSANIHTVDLVSLAKKLGRRLHDRGKHLTYVSDPFPNLRPLPIPSHPGALNPYTAENVLSQLEEDWLRWREVLGKSEDDG